jgi:hypothetical protein
MYYHHATKSYFSQNIMDMAFYPYFKLSNTINSSKVKILGIIYKLWKNISYYTFNTADEKF